MTVSKSPSNALKHGLTSRHFVPENARDLVEEIRQDLFAIHSPETGEEKQLVADLAVALWQNSEHDRLFYERQAYEQAIAGDLYAEQAQTRFQEQLEQLRSTPGLTISAFSATWLGALYMQKSFQNALASLSESLPLSFQQITDCINAIGEEWRLDLYSARGRKIMAWHLALVTNPEEEIARWVAASEPGSAAEADERARHHYASAPDTATSRCELIDLLEAELVKVNVQVTALQKEFESRRELFKSANAGFGLGDPTVTKAAMLAFRYRTTAYNRSNRLFKELDKLKAERRRTGMASVYSYCRPDPTVVAAPLPQKAQPIPEFEFVNFHLAPVQDASVAESPQKQSLRNEIRLDPAHAPFQPLKAVGIDRIIQSGRFSGLKNRRKRLAALVK